eukprot:11323561-Karenia_brevis.AAC.1
MLKMMNRKGKGSSSSYHEERSSSYQGGQKLKEPKKKLKVPKATREVPDLEESSDEDSEGVIKRVQDVNEAIERLQEVGAVEKSRRENEGVEG